MIFLVFVIKMTFFLHQAHLCCSDFISTFNLLLQNKMMFTTTIIAYDLDICFFLSNVVYFMYSKCGFAVVLFWIKCCFQLNIQHWTSSICTRRDAVLYLINKLREHALYIFDIVHFICIKFHSSQILYINKYVGFFF